MSSRVAKCEAEGGAANCTSARCPERLAHLQAFASEWTTIEAPVTAPKRKPRTRPSSGKLPFTSGARMNERKLRMTLGRAYDPAQVKRIANIRQNYFLKPKGGIWLAPDSDYGTAYETALSLGPEHGDVRHEVNFRADARVVVIDSLADYRQVLEAYPHRMESARQTPENAAAYRGTSQLAFDDAGEPRLGIDYVKLAKDYDGLYVTDAGLAACEEPGPHEISLRSWAFESALVLNPKAVEVTVTDVWSTDED